MIKIIQIKEINEQWNFPKWVIIWHAALFAIIFSFVSLSFKKNGAIKGPTAPINIDVKPPIMPTEKN